MILFSRSFSASFLFLFGLFLSLRLGMHQLFPTRREFALVLLFLLLLVLLNRGPGTSYPPNVPSSSRRHTLQAEQPALPQTQLSWKNNPVPQTKLVAHVPGMSQLLVLSRATLHSHRVQAGQFSTDYMSSKASYISYRTMRGRYRTSSLSSQEAFKLKMDKRLSSADYQRTKISVLSAQKRQGGCLE